MKVFLSDTEWYPVLDVTGEDEPDDYQRIKERYQRAQARGYSSRAKPAEIPDDLVARYRAAIAEFKAAEQAICETGDFK